MKISKIRENARIALTGKWGKAVSITLAYLAFFLVIGFVIGIIEGIFGEDSLMSNLLGIATSIIQVSIVFGLGYAFIKLKRNEEIKAFDFLNFGFSNFGRAWKIILRALLKMIVPIILLIVCIAIFSYAAIGISASIMLGQPNVTFVALALVGSILYTVTLIWIAVRTLLYVLTTYIAYDNPEMTALEVVNESARMMKGNRWKAILLDLSFIGWAILSIFTLFIGYLWLLPYMQVAAVCFYEYLLGKNETNNVEPIKEM